jgi:glycosyltransferase involved in cell wall biosynthesis
MQGSTVSVVIPTHNRAHLIERAVKSVLSQTYAHLDVIVVDDASTDGTEHVVRAFKDPRVRYLRHDKNRGACAARNTGITAGQGEYVAFLDSDDEWLPTKLAVQLKAFQDTALPEAGVVTCGYKTLYLDGRQLVWLPRKSGWLLEDILCQTYSGWGPPFLLIKRNILEKHGVRFDEQLPARQGFDFCAQLAKHCQFEIVREPLVIVHQHEGERVWTPTRAVEASLYLHDKLEAELAVRPRAHCRFHFKTAVESEEANDWKQARRQVFRGIRAHPKSPLSYLWLALYLTSTPKFPQAARTLVIKALGRTTFGAFT